MSHEEQAEVRIGSQGDARTSALDVERSFHDNISSPGRLCDFKSVSVPHRNNEEEEENGVCREAVARDYFNGP